jgi:hypothetical protein
VLLPPNDRWPLNRSALCAARRATAHTRARRLAGCARTKNIIFFKKNYKNKKNETQSRRRPKNPHLKNFVVGILGNTYYVSDVCSRRQHLFLLFSLPT